MKLERIELINPTGLKIRTADDWGSGLWGSPRGDRQHLGIDIECAPGQEIKSPCDALIIREAKPYAGEIYSGLLMRSDFMVFKMFYIYPYRHLIGKHVSAGQAIGTAQNISEKYRKQGDHEKYMIPHIHFQVDSIDPEMLNFEPTIVGRVTEI